MSEGPQNRHAKGLEGQRAKTPLVREEVTVVAIETHVVTLVDDAAEEDTTIATPPLANRSRLSAQNR
jgi:hypothetical protein